MTLNLMTQSRFITAFLMLVLVPLYTSFASSEVQPIEFESDTLKINRLNSEAFEVRNQSPTEMLKRLKQLLI